MVKKVPRTFDSVAYQSRGAFRAFETIMQRKMREIGLNIAHFDTLRILWEGDGLRQNEISERAFITESSMAQVINEMVRHELVERRMDAHDKRKRMIFLTPKALAMKEEILAATSQFYASAIKGIDPEHIKIYLKVARTLRANVMKEYDRQYGGRDPK